MGKTVKPLRNFVNGSWALSETSEYLEVENPGTGETLGVVPLSTRRDVDEAVRSAKTAFGEWSRVPILERQQYLFRMKQILEENLEELAQCITREHGKILPEARGEVKRAIENIDYAISAPALMQGRILSNAVSGVDVEMQYFPEGVFAIVSPFNFPAMIPFWFLPHALVMGNTCVVKPSEQVPLTMARIFELLEKVKFPSGVINLVNGDKQAVDSLITHPELRGVASVSSTPVMEHIANKVHQSGKKFLCNGGAKNFIVVMPDADIDEHLPNILGSVYGNTGQRCLAGSNVVAVGDASSLVRVRVKEAVTSLRVGYGLDQASQMGPLISKKARERITGYVEQGIREGARLVVDGRVLTLPKYPEGYYLGPMVFENVDSRSTIARDEIFGPVLIHLESQTLEEAIKLINASRFGNAASIYTNDPKSQREFVMNVRAGNIGVNIGVPAPIAYFPFAGMKESFMGVLHGQSDEALRFFSDIKVVTRRS